MQTISLGKVAYLMNDEFVGAFDETGRKEYCGLIVFVRSTKLNDAQSSPDRAPFSSIHLTFVKYVHKCDKRSSPLTGECVSYVVSLFHRI